MAAPAHDGSDDGDDAPCAPAEYGLTCVYGGTAFTCAPCTGSLCIASEGHANYAWQTTALREECPVEGVPNWGGPCTSEGLICDYNRCADDVIGSGGHSEAWVHGAAMVCEHGQWTSHVRAACL